MRGQWQVSLACDLPANIRLELVIFREPPGGLAAELVGRRKGLSGALAAHLKEDTSPINAHRVALQRLGDRRTGRPAIAYIKLPLVQGALDFVAVQKTIAKPGMPVRADVVGRKDTSGNLVQGNAALADLQSDDIVFGYFGLAGSVNPG